MTDVVPVERLTSRADLFRCEPYRAVITARACLARQEGARRAPAPGVAASAARNSACEGCALGGRVAERLSAYPDDGSRPVVPTCAHPGCGAPVIGARHGQRPLCPEHRKHNPQQPKETDPMPAKKTDAATCAAKGCTRAPGGARKNTQPALAPLCIRHRHRAHQLGHTMEGGIDAAVAAIVAGTLPTASEARRAAGKKTAAKRRAAPAGPARASAPAADPFRIVPTDAAVIDRVTRALRIVEALGGLERAEKIAEAMGVAS